jgi:coenzyme PQQ precursor peptide PqqA
MRYRAHHEHPRKTLMRWETPQATEFRFGMEITLYIARR